MPRLSGGRISEVFERGRCATHGIVPVRAAPCFNDLRRRSFHLILASDVPGSVASLSCFFRSSKNFHRPCKCLRILLVRLSADALLRCHQRLNMARFLSSLSGNFSIASGLITPTSGISMPSKYGGRPCNTLAPSSTLSIH